LDKKVRAVLGVEVVDDDDVRMVELGEGKGFLAEALTGGFVGQSAGGKDFECHVPVEAFIVSAVDHTHPASSDLLQDAVVGKRGLHGASKVG
jgi:hypothetical protein